MKVQLTIMFLLISFGFAAANHASFNLPEIVNTINQNSDAIPKQLAQIFGNERINVYFEDGVIGAVTVRGKITEYYSQEISNPTLKVYLDSRTATALAERRESLNAALASGKVRYEAIDAITKIKMIIAEIARSIFSDFFN